MGELSRSHEQTRGSQDVRRLREWFRYSSRHWPEMGKAKQVSSFGAQSYNQLEGSGHTSQGTMSKGLQGQVGRLKKGRRRNEGARKREVIGEPIWKDLKFSEKTKMNYSNYSW